MPIIQTLSLDVPAKCPNNCRYCVAKTHSNDYPNNLNPNGEFFDVYLDDFISQLKYVRNCGCQTVILTGSREPLFNKNYLVYFALINNNILPTPFEKIELQTSGVDLDSNFRFLRNTVNVKTISLSLSDMFDDESNANISQMPNNLRFKIKDLCQKTLSYGFTLRLSLNMADVYNYRTPEEIFNQAKSLGAHQLTIRVLYSSPNGNTEQDNWIKDHSCDPNVIKQLNEYVVKNGNKLGVLPFGATKYSVNEMSVVVDSDSMSTKTEEIIKYAILRPNCQLYTKWEDKGSRL